MKKVTLFAVVCLALLVPTRPALAQSGGLDPSFGNGGVVTTSFGANSFQFSGAALAPNGDIVVAGNLQLPPQSVDGGTETFTLAAVLRYLPSGALDSSFGTNGMVTIPPPSTGSSFGTLAAVQPGGQILVTLITLGFNGINFTAGEDVLVRLQSNGKVDTTFGSAGQISLSNFALPAGYVGVSSAAIQLQSDGKILVSGVVTPPFRSKLPDLTLLARFLSNGTPDTSFGTAGTTEVAAIGAPTAIAFSGTNILVGNFLGGVAEFSASGALLKTSPLPEAAVSTTLIPPASFESNGDLLVGSTEESPALFKDNSDALVLRYNLAGLDTSFNSPEIRLAPDAPFEGNAPVGVGTDSEGRVLAGIARGFVQGRTGTPLFAVARLNSNGSFDTTFGNGGLGTIVSNLSFSTILVQPNNDVVAVGNGVLARFLAQ
jgi:uncharacterized delta-60 repeat protein